MSTEEIYTITLRVIAILEAMSVNYELGGSLASSVHGTPRSTLDADIVADLKSENVADLIRRLGSEFYADEQMIENAIRAKKCFNVIHLGTMLKLDIFPIKDTAFSRVEFSRRVQAHFPDASGPLVWLSSPEDIILHKLVWYLEGGEVAKRQYSDVLGVLRVTRSTLDKAYLSKWAETLGVKHLLDRALLEAEPLN